MSKVVTFFMFLILQHIDAHCFVYDNDDQLIASQEAGEHDFRLAYILTTYIRNGDSNQFKHQQSTCLRIGACTYITSADIFSEIEGYKRIARTLYFLSPNEGGLFQCSIKDENIYKNDQIALINIHVPVYDSHFELDFTLLPGIGNVMSWGYINNGFDRYGSGNNFRQKISSIEFLYSKGESRKIGFYLSHSDKRAQLNCLKGDIGGGLLTSKNKLFGLILKGTYKKNNAISENKIKNCFYEGILLNVYKDWILEKLLSWEEEIYFKKYNSLEIDETWSLSMVHIRSSSV